MSQDSSEIMIINMSTDQYDFLNELKNSQTTDDSKTKIKLSQLNNI